jgi:hypothetical protein
MVTTKDGCKRNGNLLFTIRPIQAALQQDYDRQMQKLRIRLTIICQKSFSPAL